MSDDDAWEDIIQPKPSPLKSTNGRSSSPTGSIRSQASRKRKGATKTVFVATSPRRQYTVPSPAKTTIRKSVSPPIKPASTTTGSTISKEEFKDAVSSGAVHTLRYGLDVFKISVSLLRRPLSFLLFLWLLAFIIARINQTLRVAFAPLCIIPGLSRFCQFDYSPHDHSPPQWADYPRLIDVQSATFEQLLDESVGGSGLALEIKKAEMATVDLGTLVRVSNLKSRDMIAESLTEFVEDAKKTGRGLQKLSSKVGGAVDGYVCSSLPHLNIIHVNIASLRSTITPCTRLRAHYPIHHPNSLFHRSCPSHLPGNPQTKSSHKLSQKP